MFSTPSIQSTFTAFNVNSFGGFFGFGIYSSPDTVYYYVMDTLCLYITGYINVWLVDQDLNILINCNPDAYPCYMGIS